MATLMESDPQLVEKLRQKLLSPGTSLPEKYRVLFSLRNVKGSVARDALIDALKDSSCLFRHDVAFCLGQRQEPEAIEALKAVLRNTAEHPMVRHEAGEALGAIATEDCLQPLREHVHDAAREVAETCQLALQRIQRLPQQSQTNNESPYLSVDPTPALPASTPTQELKKLLLDEEQQMFDRYQALFALRNKGGQEAVEAMGQVFTTRSALLKHEVAYVFGQMQDPHSADILTQVLQVAAGLFLHCLKAARNMQDPSEHPMVRHEAAEALGSIASSATIQLLKEFSQDPEPIVAHSCIVALDMLDFEQSGQFEYADLGEKPTGSCACQWYETAAS